MVRNEKLQYDVNRESVNILELSLVKIDKTEYLTREEIFPSYQNRIIDEPKLTYSVLEKAFESETEAIEDAAKTQAIENSNLNRLRKKKI